MTELDIHWAPISDLSPLRGMNLTKLNCGGTPVADLAALRGMPLQRLICDYTQIQDFSPLRDVPLRWLTCDFKPERDAHVLRSIKTLETINHKPVAELWKDMAAQQARFESWCKQVAAMPAMQQVAAVAAELKKRNPGFDGQVDHKIENDVVTGVRFVSDEVTDLTPLRALKQLTSVGCNGSKVRGGSGTGKLTDLSPLKGLPLRWLFCAGNSISDLTALRGLPLEHLDCGECPVRDFTPLKDLPLQWLVCYQTALSDLSPLAGKKGFWFLVCHHTRVHDLAPLAGLPLSHLDCRYTDVADLAPLKGAARLKELMCSQTRVTDFAPVKDAPLKTLVCDPEAFRGTAILRESKTLETINGKPAAEVWKNLGDSPKP